MEEINKVHTLIDGFTLNLIHVGVLFGACKVIEIFFFGFIFCECQ